MKELTLNELVIINGGNDCVDGNHEESTAYQVGQVVGEILQGIGNIIDAISPFSD
ncbi:hypothetical protein J8L88_02625 [Aquimarina sp. MMG015]|uniref:hypothetical protein n=1 Tax=Aquimarina sp. MMG015 TaxID=2822689 RepID=UPI001B3A5544|nr:hypothetical protein [Aquimarina sp. MMG015]MBQ4801731.1 hypothetical protein [Aquimarina sp. MMG015]